MKGYMLFIVLPAAGLAAYFSAVLPESLQQIFIMGILFAVTSSVLLKPVTTLVGYICSYKAVVAQAHPKPKPRKPRPRITRTKVQQRTSSDSTRRRVA